MSTTAANLDLFPESTSAAELVSPDAFARKKAELERRKQVIREATQLAYAHLKSSNPLTSPSATRNYLTLELAGEEREVFCCLLLDTRHRVIGFHRLFYGTIDAAHVHPREVLKLALLENASAMIIAHNHPSGVAEPSQADLAITRRLRDALGLVDIRLLDHFIVGGKEVVSMAERGLV